MGPDMNSIGEPWSVSDIERRILIGRARAPVRPTLRILSDWLL